MAWRHGGRSQSWAGAELWMPCWIAVGLEMSNFSHRVIVLVFFERQH